MSTIFLSFPSIRVLNSFNCALEILRGVIKLIHLTTSLHVGVVRPPSYVLYLVSDAVAGAMRSFSLKPVTSNLAPELVIFSKASVRGFSAALSSL